MKRIIIALFVVATLVSCSKKRTYICNGIYNGTGHLWYPSQTPISNAELKAHIKHSEELGITDIKCIER
jgi:hypothetical protein